MASLRFWLAAPVAIAQRTIMRSLEHTLVIMHIATTTQSATSSNSNQKPLLSRYVYGAFVAAAVQQPALERWQHVRRAAVSQSSSTYMPVATQAAALGQVRRVC